MVSCISFEVQVVSLYYSNSYCKANCIIFFFYIEISFKTKDIAWRL